MRLNLPYDLSHRCTSLAAGPASGGAGAGGSDEISVWAPEPFEPVAFFRINQLGPSAVAKLPRPCRVCVYVLIFGLCS